MMKTMNPAFNKVYLIQEPTLLLIHQGNGPLEVDFEVYPNVDGNAVFLSNGQYIRFYSDDFDVVQFTFRSNDLRYVKDCRVLFKHLIALGTIALQEEETRNFLEWFSGKEDSGRIIIDYSTARWFRQDPFHASMDEYRTLFDIKDIIDTHYTKKSKGIYPGPKQIRTPSEVRQLFQNKVGISIPVMIGRHRLKQSLKELAFTDKSIKEVALGNGYGSTSYFHRICKQSTGDAPSDFRSGFDFEQKDSFLQNFIELIKKHHQQHRELAFYADRLHLSVRSLTRKTRQKLHMPPGRLIRQEVLRSAEHLLGEGLPVKDVAIQLGFDEPSQFSHFFRTHTGHYPSARDN